MSDCPECGMRDDDWFLCRREPCAINKTKRDGDRIADLERQIAELRAGNAEHSRKWLQAEQDLLAAEAENARLRALPLKDEVERVLEPFAREAERWEQKGGVYWPDSVPFPANSISGIKIGHLRAARDLLSKTGRTGE